MIVKIKTFSGENLYLSEDDYLDEVMYSDMSTGEKVGLGVAGTGALAGAGLYGNRIYQLNKLAKAHAGDIWKDMSRADKKEYRKDILKDLEGKKWKEMKWGQRGAKYGKKAAIGAAALGALGAGVYGISRYNKKQKNHSFYDDDDYLDEVMYSDKLSKEEKIALGIGGAGAAVGAGSAGYRQWLGHKMAKADWPGLYERNNFMGKARMRRTALAELDEIPLKAIEEYNLGGGKKIGKNAVKAGKLGRYGAIGGAAVGAAGLGAAYALSKRDKKKR